MSWEDVWKIGLTIIGSFGGIAVVVGAIVKYMSEIIAKRLEEKYSHKLTKALEKYKSGLENKSYISKAKFDVEFNIYRELSKAFFELVKDISIMIPSGFIKRIADKDKRKEYENKTYDLAKNSICNARSVLYQNAPFISQDIYEKYDEILRLSYLQIDAFEQRWNAGYLASQEEKETFSAEDYSRTSEINQKIMVVNNDIREYLSTLDILEK